MRTLRSRPDFLWRLGLVERTTAAANYIATNWLQNKGSHIDAEGTSQGTFLVLGGMSNE